MTLEKPHPLQSRKPAKRMAEVPHEVCEALSTGLLESMNLVEWLSVNRMQLLEHIAREYGWKLDQAAIELLHRETCELAALKKSHKIADYLTTVVTVGDASWNQMAVHKSDVVREWAALLIGRSSHLSILKKLAWMKPLADDENAGVREIAWIAMRADVIREPEECIRRLVPWTGSRNLRLRRFASELTRPRGVWASHVEALKRQPQLAMDILEPLKADDAKYVKDSVGNWLNDASKSQPDWVRQVTDRWRSESDSPHTAYIVKRALRTIDKK